MLAALLALGIIPSASSTPDPEPGVVAIPADMVAVLKPVTTDALVSTGLPLGAARFLRQLDPSDEKPYAFDWSEVIGADVSIATIERMTPSALGVQYGVMILADADHPTTIDVDGHLVSFWPVVSEAFEFNPAFSGIGVPVGISMRIGTDQDPPQYHEQTAVLTVRQK